MHNTSDGLDLLYASSDATIVIRRIRAEGNAGNQVKTSGPVEIENSIIVGNCAFFKDQSFTASGDYNADGQIESAVENCRASGNALSLDLRRGNRAIITNNSLTGQGTCLVFAQCAQEGNCEGNERVLLQNDLFIGQTDFTNTTETSCLSYYENLTKDPFEIGYSFIYGVKTSDCPDSHNTCGIDPRITSMESGQFCTSTSGKQPIDRYCQRVEVPSTGFPRSQTPPGQRLRYRCN